MRLPRRPTCRPRPRRRQPSPTRRRPPTRSRRRRSRRAGARHRQRRRARPPPRHGVPTAAASPPRHGARRRPPTRRAGGVPAPLPAAAAAAPTAPAQPATPSVPAGWYHDPAGRFELRYWDGSAWTEHVSRRRPAVHRPARRLRQAAPLSMRATSLGHAGILIESDHGSIVCDPWFVPAFLGSWFPFPRNDRLDDDLLARIEGADFLYVSHLHGDHWDEPWLRAHLPRDIGVLLPGYPTPRARPPDARARLHEPDPHRRPRGARPRRPRRRHPRRDEHHRRPRWRLGAGRQRRHGPHRRPERLPHDGSRRPAQPRPRRPALAAVQRGDLVPDGLRPGTRGAAAPRAGEGRQPAGPGDALRRVGRCPRHRAERRAAVLPRPRAVPPQRHHRGRAEHLRRPAGVPRAPRRLRPPRHPRRARHDDRRDPRRHRRHPPRRRRRGDAPADRQGDPPARVPGRLAALDRRAEGRLDQAR